jgi:hypothetical protein
MGQNWFTGVYGLAVPLHVTTAGVVCMLKVAMPSREQA